jgi:hypothetical protein
MARQSEYASGEACEATGTYEQINIFGRLTGIRVTVTHGQPFPEAPRGHMWTLADQGADGG